MKFVKLSRETLIVRTEANFVAVGDLGILVERCKAIIGLELLRGSCVRGSDEIMTRKSPTDELPAPKNCVQSLK